MPKAKRKDRLNREQLEQENRQLKVEELQMGIDPLNSGFERVKHTMQVQGI